MHPRIESNDGGVQVGNFVLADRQIPIEDIQKLSLDPTDITLSEDAGSDGPMDVLESGVVRELEQEIRIRILSPRRRNMHTFEASIRAPRKTRWRAHSSASTER